MDLPVFPFRAVFLGKYFRKSLANRKNTVLFPFRAVLFRENCRKRLASRMNAVLFPFREGYTLKLGKNPSRNGRRGVTAVSRKHLRRNTGNPLLETDSTASYEFRAGEALEVSAENHTEGV